MLNLHTQKVPLRKPSKKYKFPDKNGIYKILKNIALAYRHIRAKGILKNTSTPSMD